MSGVCDVRPSRARGEAPPRETVALFARDPPAAAAAGAEGVDLERGPSRFVRRRRGIIRRASHASASERASRAELRRVQRRDRGHRECVLTRLLSETEGKKRVRKRRSPVAAQGWLTSQKKSLSAKQPYQRTSNYVREVFHLTSLVESGSARVGNPGGSATIRLPGGAKGPTAACSRGPPHR